MTNSKPPEAPPSPELLSPEEIREVLEEIVEQTNRNTLSIEELGRRGNKIMLELIAYRLAFPLLAICFVILAIGRNS